MIQPQELLLGNNILYCGKVCSVTLNTLENLTKQENQEYYNPIPLTEEWLLKFGAKPSNNNDWFILNGITFGYLTKDIIQLEYKIADDINRKRINANRLIFFVHLCYGN